MSITDTETRQLNELRQGLLVLHKTLLDTQRLWYEREHGRLESPGQMLQLLVSDPAFAWLRLLSALIVQIDEKMDDKESPMMSSDVSAILGEARGMLLASDSSEEFQRNYNRALQEQPDVVIAQSRVARLLGR